MSREREFTETAIIGLMVVIFFWKLGNFDFRSIKSHVRIKSIILTGAFNKPSQKRLGFSTAVFLKLWIKKNVRIFSNRTFLVSCEKYGQSKSQC